MFTFLVPISVREWFTSNVQTRAERLFAIADRQLDQMEAELVERQAFALPKLIDAPSKGRKTAIVR